MANIEKEKKTVRLTLGFSNLTIPNEKRAELEKLADEMGNLADSLGYLDPLEEEPAVVFDPRF